MFFHYYSLRDLVILSISFSAPATSTVLAREVHPTDENSPRGTARRLSVSREPAPAIRNRALGIFLLSFIIRKDTTSTAGKRDIRSPSFALPRFTVRQNRES
jgi:hypothetical protein